MNEKQKRFYSLLAEDNTRKGDVERLQLFYVLACNNSLWNVVSRIYNTKLHQLVEGWEDTCDGSALKMLKRSVHLYNSHNEDIPTVRLFWGLDESNSRIMNNAQRIYCNQFDFENEDWY